MGVATRRPGPNWATAALRAAGRRPGVAAIGAALLVLAGLGIGWATQLWSLPDVGDPFDVAAFEAHRVPDDRNAFIEYEPAASLLRAARKGTVGLQRATYSEEWSKAGQPWRDLVAKARPALDLWRVGTEKPDFLYHHPDGLSFNTLLPVSQELSQLAKLAVLEGSRLESEGDMAGAWGWYRAALRSSRHSGRHGFMMERLIAAGGMHPPAAKALTRWAADPRVDAPLLRRALAEVIAIDALTAPRSDALKLDYLVFVHSLNDPDLLELLAYEKRPGDPTDWAEGLPVPKPVKKTVQAVRLVASDDRERSLRVIRLFLANWLAEVDRPLSRRVPLARTDPPIYAPDPTAPPAARALTPERLARWHDSTLLARPFVSFLTSGFAPIERERTRQAKLVVHLADQLYRRDHGGPPPSPAALVGPYLQALPEGLDGPADLPGPRP